MSRYVLKGVSPQKGRALLCFEKYAIERTAPPVGRTLRHYKSTAQRDERCCTDRRERQTKSPQGERVYFPPVFPSTGKGCGTNRGVSSLSRDGPPFTGRGENSLSTRFVGLHHKGGFKTPQWKQYAYRGFGGEHILNDDGQAARTEQKQAAPTVEVGPHRNREGTSKRRRNH